MYVMRLFGKEESCALKQTVAVFLTYKTEHILCVAVCSALAALCEKVCLWYSKDEFSFSRMNEPLLKLFTLWIFFFSFMILIHNMVMFNNMEDKDTDRNKIEEEGN